MTEDQSGSMEPTTELEEDAALSVHESLEKALSEDAQSEEAESAPEEALELSKAPEVSEAPVAEPEPEYVPVAAPAGMTAEQKERFAQLSPAEQQFLSEQYTGWQRSYTQKQMQLAEQAKRYQALGNVLEPVMNEYQRQGVAPEQVVQRAIAWDQAFKQDPVQAARQFLDSYGVDAEELLDVENMHPEARYQNDPYIQELQEKLEAQEQWRAQQEQAQRQQYVQTVQGELNQFLADKPLFKDPGTAAQLEAEMAPIVTSLKQQMPQASTVEILDRAYNYVAYGNEQFRSLLEAQSKRQQIAAEQQRTAAKEKLSASVTGGPGTGQPSKKIGSIQDSLEAAFDEHGL